MDRSGAMIVYRQLTVVAVVCALAACAQKKAPPPRPKLAVAVETVRPVAFVPRLTVLGTVQPLQSVAIRTRVDGEITAVLFREGDVVRAGQPLFRLDDRAVRAQIGQAQATLASAVATNQQAVADLKRSQALVANGFVSKATIEIKQAAAGTSSAGIGGARAALNAAQTALSYLTIVAPVSGRTGEIGYKLGATVRAADTTPLVTINQLTPILVRFAVPPEQIQPLRRALAGGPVTVTAKTHDDPTPLATGKLVFLDNNVDASTGALAAKAEFVNAGDALWPGGLVDIEVPVGIEHAYLAVPETAVQNGPDFTYVWSVDGGETVALTKVAVAGRQGGRAYIGSGLADGARVVTDSLAKLRPGDKVRIKTVTAGVRPA